MTELPTRDRLVQTAAQLFRKKGYHGVGMAEILARAQAPKGSLYHHFPNGKSDLALAAANWASEGMSQIVEDAFAEAPDYPSGLTTLCHKLAKFYDLNHGWDGCPVSNTLFEGPENAAFQARMAEIFDDWIARITGHGVRLGWAPQTAEARARSFLMLIQGAWIMARAQGGSDVIRQVPEHLFPAS